MIAFIIIDLLPNKAGREISLDTLRGVRNIAECFNPIGITILHYEANIALPAGSDSRNVFHDQGTMRAKQWNRTVHLVPIDLSHDYT